MEWRKFEESIKKLLKADLAVTTPGSGNSKTEEDIVGYSTICQCKYTTKDNISILSKDLERLKNAAKLQCKTPIFVNKSNKDIILSIPSQSYITDVIEYIVLLSKIDKVIQQLNNIDDPKTVKRLRIMVDTDIRLSIGSFIDKVQRKYHKVDGIADSKYNNSIQHNLFE